LIGEMQTDRRGLEEACTIVDLDDWHPSKLVPTHVLGRTPVLRPIRTAS
jgi:hypothetical protein